jgi:hypothetical protein
MTPNERETPRESRIRADVTGYTAPTIEMDCHGVKTKPRTPEKIMTTGKSIAGLTCGAVSTWM